MNIFTIPPDVDFVAALAEGLLADSQQRGVPLADYRVLLPTHRAGRALRAAFVKLGGAMLLPRLQPLGELDEDALGFAEAAASLESEALPAAIDPLRRRLLLAQLLQKHHDATLAADGAWQLAGALGALLDEMQITQLPAAALRDIVPAELAAHWQKILQFLQIITEHWPQLLAAQELLDPVTRRNRIVARQAELWVKSPPDYPVVAAGSTASMPATATLLRTIAALPQGMVVLPGLDQNCAAEVWDALDPTHPQYTMREWLKLCEVAPRFVKTWPCGARAHPARVQLLQTAFMPACQTVAWQDLSAQELAPDALADVSLCVAETLDEEAQIIALKLRATLAVPERTAMLVTRDRQLAARVANQLRRWDVVIDDSSGQDLATTPLGIFLQLVVTAASPDAGAVDFLALLKHPLAALGDDPALCRATARQAEKQLWRGHRLRGAPERQARHLTEKMPDHKAIAGLLKRLGAALQPLTELLLQQNVPLAALLTAHAQAAEAIAATAVQEGTQNLWCGAAGDIAASLWHDGLAAADGYTLRVGAEYPALIRSWLVENSVRPAYGLHPRLSILGPLEARLLSADCVILGGMNEDSWPGVATLDPWLSRPMRAACGLPQPERQIGQAAHDCVQLASRGEVLFTRARKVDGQPTVPSRFLLRLETLLQALGRAATLAPTEPWAAWARALDTPVAIQAMPRPEPRPVVALRPKRFSVTEIGGWRCNPYGFYAKHILRLKPLDPLDPDVSRSDFGTAVHGILEQFIMRHRLVLPSHDKAIADFLALSTEALRDYADEPVLYAAWQAQCANLAQSFVAEEEQRRVHHQPVQTECQATLLLKVDGVTYELVGRPDRLDQSAEGMTIIDYKTGYMPTDKQVAAGIEPQMPLLGLMVAEGAFAGVSSRTVHELLYWKLTGRVGHDELHVVKDGQGEIPKARAMLEAMLRRYADPHMPYLVEPQPEYVPRFDDYRHLGRIEEWGLAGGGDES